MAAPGYAQPAPGYAQPAPGYAQPAPGYAQPPPPGYAPPGYVQPPPPQPSGPVMNQATNVAVNVGGGGGATGPMHCPICKGTKVLDYTLLGWIIAIVFFPEGILCCLLCKKPRCRNCQPMCHII